MPVFGPGCNMVGSCSTSTAGQSLNTSFCHKDRREMLSCALAMNQEAEGKTTGGNKENQYVCEPC